MEIIFFFLNILQKKIHFRGHSIHTEKHEFSHTKDQIVTFRWEHMNYVEAFFQVLNLVQLFTSVNIVTVPWNYIVLIYFLNFLQSYKFGSTSEYNLGIIFEEKTAIFFSSSNEDLLSFSTN